MKFGHLVFGDENNIDSKENVNNNILILLDDNVEDENSRIVAQAISLDIRGDFGFFLNRKKSENLKYSWKGDLFNVDVVPNENKVEISNIIYGENVYNDEDNVYSFTLNDWEEALLDWKEFYLQTLGFLEFRSQALSHVIGVLILTYDQMVNEICDEELIIEAMKRCSKRYGINISVIYRDCRKVTELRTIREFYNWVRCLLENRCNEQCWRIINNINKNYGERIENIINKRLDATLI